MTSLEREHSPWAARATYISRDDDRSGITRDEERARLSSLEVELDRAWDLLRQRKALRDSGGSPDDAAERSGDVVEKYLS